MNDSEITQAGRDAERFIIAMNDYFVAMEKFGCQENRMMYHSPCPRESGALKRASMDLTRQLARMRRSKSYE